MGSDVETGKIALRLRASSFPSRSRKRWYHQFDTLWPNSALMAAKTCLVGTMVPLKSKASRVPTMAFSASSLNLALPCR